MLTGLDEPSLQGEREQLLSFPNLITAHAPLGSPSFRSKLRPETGHLPGPRVTRLQPPSEV